MTSANSSITHPDMEDTGSGLDYGTKPETLLGDITPNHQFFIRSHAPTPEIDPSTWELRIEGDGIREPVKYSYPEICSAFPVVSVTRTIECAGNRRVLFGREVGKHFEGTQWARGAISTAEWTGVRLRDLLEPAGLTDSALEVMPESLDAVRARRPLPLAKALADDTVVAFAMNGEHLPPDHGFPARLVVSGWLGAASIKWLGRIEVSEHALQVPWNTEDYVLIDGRNSAGDTESMSVITEPALSTLVELPWPAHLPPGPHLIRGRAFAGEARVAKVETRIDGGPWVRADIISPGESGLWARWQMRWTAAAGDHVLRVRVTDDRGRVQPESTPPNALGYMHQSVLAHPIRVSDGNN